MPTSPSDESENESVYVCESVDKDKGTEVGDKPVYAGAPTVEDVAAYCQESGYTIDPAAFVRWNEARGWMNGKKYIAVDWKKLSGNGFARKTASLIRRWRCWRMFVLMCSAR